MSDWMAGIEFSGQLRQSPRWETTATYSDLGSLSWAAMASALEAYFWQNAGTVASANAIIETSLFILQIYENPVSKKISNFAFLWMNC